MMTKISIIIIEGIDLILYRSIQFFKRINTFQNKEFIIKWFIIVLTIIITIYFLYKISKGEVDSDQLLIISSLFLLFLIFLPVYYYTKNIPLKDRKLSGIELLLGSSANADKNDTIDEACQPSVEDINIPLHKMKQYENLNLQKINFELLQEFENFFENGKFEKFIKIATTNQILNNECIWVFRGEANKTHPAILYFYLKRNNYFKSKNSYTLINYTKITNELFKIQVDKSMYSKTLSDFDDVNMTIQYKEFLQFKDN